MRTSVIDIDYVPLVDRLMSAGENRVTDRSADRESYGISLNSAFKDEIPTKDAPESRSLERFHVKTNADSVRDTIAENLNRVQLIQNQRVAHTSSEFYNGRTPGLLAHRQQSTVATSAHE